jgi:hypothetical protein
MPIPETAVENLPTSWPISAFCDIKISNFHNLQIGEVDFCLYFHCLTDEFELANEFYGQSRKDVFLYFKVFLCGKAFISNIQTYLCDKMHKKVFTEKHFLENNEISP